MIYLCKNADEQKVNYLYLSIDLTFLFNENMHISEGMVLLEITHEEYDYIFNYDVNKNIEYGWEYCPEISEKAYRLNVDKYPEYIVPFNEILKNKEIKIEV